MSTCSFATTPQDTVPGAHQRSARPTWTATLRSRPSPAAATASIARDERYLRVGGAVLPRATRSGATSPTRLVGSDTELVKENVARTLYDPTLTRRRLI